MGKTVLSTSTSVDGFTRPAGATPGEPLGKRGERLHHWEFNGTDEDRALLQESIKEAGAVIVGRTTYVPRPPRHGRNYHCRFALHGPRLCLRLIDAVGTTT